MANKIYQLSYDDEVDKDIHDWLESIPRYRKSELVRHALRYYIATTGGSKNIQMPPVATPVDPVIESAPQPQPAPVETVEEKPKQRKKPSLPLDGKF